MIISLGSSGRSMYLTVNQYLDMTDDEFKAAQMYNLGCYFEHPFLDTCLISLCNEQEEFDEIEEAEEPEEEYLFSDKDIEELMSNEPED